MKKFYRAEIITIAFIFFYQFANKSSEQEIFGIGKMIIFTAFGFYSIIITVLEFFYIKKDLKNRLIVLNANDRVSFLGATILFAAIGVLIFLNKTVNSTNYGLNILFGLVYLVKSILCGIVVTKIKNE